MEPFFDWDSLDDVKYRDEAESLRLAAARLVSYRRLASEIEAEAAAVIERARSNGVSRGFVNSILEHIDLASDEGRALMRICEGFQRSANWQDRDTLIHEQFSQAQWKGIGGSGGLRVKGLAFLLRLARSLEAQSWARPVGVNLAIRRGVSWGVSRMAREFVLDETIDGALKRARKEEMACSFDMLGEGARTTEDADRYEASYSEAIAALANGRTLASPESAHNVSIKLSALDCHYEATKEGRAFERLYPRLERLMLQAAAGNIDFYIDAEECDRLVLSLKLLDRLDRAAPKGWDGLGLAVQAYQRRATDVVDRAIAFARSRGRRLKVRLVKGAYWDGEIKRAQVAGTESFPVFTSKPATDISYLACAETMLAARPDIYPAFATHNAHTVTAISHLAAASDEPFEFQRLHGMGQSVYDAAGDAKVRVYAPVGLTNDLLPYLVRRLLENGANSSFVSKLRNRNVEPAAIARDPLDLLLGPGRDFKPRVEDPGNLYGSARRNARGFDLSNKYERGMIESALQELDDSPVAAVSLVKGAAARMESVKEIRSPADRSRIIGTAALAHESSIDGAFTAALEAQAAWDRLGGKGRAEILTRIGDEIERAMPRLVALLSREAGKTLPDGVAEVREAVDFCRFYAAAAARQFSRPRRLRGPAGESNSYVLRGRGVFVCISPWNFPLAIFVGQVVAALAAGNAVIAKPAEQTPLIAHEAIRLFLCAGLEPGLISLLLGDGKFGAKLVRDERHSGVAFTGSNDAATEINKALAYRDGPIARLVAETGGLNAIFADETALVEHLIDDVLLSSFGAAGQRCSSARFLVIPESVGPAIVRRLELAMAELAIGDPSRPETDMGPLIDDEARSGVVHHIEEMRRSGCRVTQMPVPDNLGLGTFVPPTMIEIPSLDGLEKEVFGPVLHVLTCPPGEAASVARALRRKGYGLTLGIHTRLERFETDIREACSTGNIYVNRSTIGAVVGVQPFGGFGMSGTGPKAGGPNSLHPYADEIVVSENLMAKGGDLDLINRSA